MVRPDQTHKYTVTFSTLIHRIIIDIPTWILFRPVNHKKYRHIKTQAHFFYSRIYGVNYVRENLYLKRYRMHDHYHDFLSHTTILAHSSCICRRYLASTRPCSLKPMISCSRSCWRRDHYPNEIFYCVLTPCLKNFRHCLHSRPSRKATPNYHNRRNHSGCVTGLRSARRKPVCDSTAFEQPNGSDRHDNTHLVSEYLVDNHGTLNTGSHFDAATAFSA